MTPAAPQVPEPDDTPATGQGAATPSASDEAPTQVRPPADAPLPAAPDVPSPADAPPIGEPGAAPAPVPGGDPPGAAAAQTPTPSAGAPAAPALPPPGETPAAPVDSSLTSSGLPNPHGLPEIAVERPEVAVGAAFAGGLLLALILKRFAR